MWAIECLQQIKAASKGETRHCCPDPVQTAAMPGSCRSCSAWPGARSWKCPSPVQGGLLPTRSPLGDEDTQPQCFGELEAAQRSAPGVLAAVACADFVPGGAAALSVLPNVHFLSAEGAHPALATAGEVPFPTGLGLPTVTLLLFPMTLCQRCSCSSPGPSFPAPFCHPAHWRETGQCAIF